VSKKKNLLDRTIISFDNGPYPGHSTQAVTTPGKSIYELVTQKIDLPEGLQYRGKYCGKNKLRLKK